MPRSPWRTCSSIHTGSSWDRLYGGESTLTRTLSFAFWISLKNRARDFANSWNEFVDFVHRYTCLVRSPKKSRAMSSWLDGNSRRLERQHLYWSRGYVSRLRRSSDHRYLIGTIGASEHSGGNRTKSSSSENSWAIATPSQVSSGGSASSLRRKMPSVATIRPNVKRSGQNYARGAIAMSIRFVGADCAERKPRRSFTSLVFETRVSVPGSFQLMLSCVGH